MTTLCLCAAVKILGMVEWAPLYRLFLFIPAEILSFFFGAEYDERGGVYTFPAFILDYSCSGIHFFMVAALLVSLKSRKTWGGFLTALAAAYTMTLAANTARVALFLKVEHFSVGRAWLHEAVGTVVFISFLLSFYLVWEFFAKRVGGTNAAER